MKRRGFLGMISAAVVAPVLPGAAPKTAIAATYNRYTYGLAVFHARTRAHVSARGLAFCLKVTVPQAEAMIARMAREGLVKPVFAGGAGQMRAVSNILRPDAWGLDRAARKARSADRRARHAATEAVPQDWLAYLRQLCERQGLPLHPRCTQVEVAG